MENKIVLYFTATGNSLYAAKRLGGELLSVPRMMREGRTEFEADTIGIVAPVYCGNLPKMVRKFLKTASFKTDYLYFIATYGMNDSVAKANVLEAAKESGAKFSYVKTLLMVDQCQQVKN